MPPRDENVRISFEGIATSHLMAAPAALTASHTHETLDRPLRYKVPVKGVRQQQTYWCWAACAEMILNKFSIEKNQCEIVSRTLGIDECCEDGSTADCNQPLKISRVTELYEAYGINVTYRDGDLSMDEIVEHVSANHVLKVGLVWWDPPFSGHAVIINGYDLADDDDEPLVLFVDPNRSVEAGSTPLRLLQSGWGAGVWRHTWSG